MLRKLLLHEMDILQGDAGVTLGLPLSTVIFIARSSFLRIHPILSSLTELTLFYNSAIVY